MTSTIRERIYIPKLIKFSLCSGSIFSSFLLDKTVTDKYSLKQDVLQTLRQSLKVSPSIHSITHGAFIQKPYPLFLTSFISTLTSPGSTHSLLKQDAESRLKNTDVNIIKRLLPILTRLAKQSKFINF